MLLFVMRILSRPLLTMLLTVRLVVRRFLLARWVRLFRFSFMVAMRSIVVTSLGRVRRRSSRKVLSTRSVRLLIVHLILVR